MPRATSPRSSAITSFWRRPRSPAGSRSPAKGPACSPGPPSSRPRPDLPLPDPLGWCSISGCRVRWRSGSSRSFSSSWPGCSACSAKEGRHLGQAQAREGDHRGPEDDRLGEVVRRLSRRCPRTPSSPTAPGSTASSRPMVPASISSRRGAGRPVPVHGYPGFWWTWRGAAGARRPVIARSPSTSGGFGWLDKPPSGYDLTTAAADLAGLIRSPARSRPPSSGTGSARGPCVTWCSRPRWSAPSAWSRCRRPAGSGRMPPLPRAPNNCGTTCAASANDHPARPRWRRRQQWRGRAGPARGRDPTDDG